MGIEYLTLKLRLQFEQPIQWNVLPTFHLRSILGARLKRMTCIQHSLRCEECFLKNNCAYAYLFETIIDKQTPGLEGRNRAIHPFMLRHGLVYDSGSRYDFFITIIGKAVRLTPYILFAFQEAGKEGIFSSAIHYDIQEITNEINHLRIDPNHIAGLETKNFHFQAAPGNGPARYRIEFETPARIKHFGKYSTDFDAMTFWNTIYRRISILSRLYCDEDLPPIDPEQYINHVIEKKALYWKDFSRYSQRQQQAMELGGAIGSFVIAGTMGETEKSLLEAGRLFQIGKNTVFGLGSMRYTAI